MKKFRRFDKVELYNSIAKQIGIKPINKPSEIKNKVKQLTTQHSSDLTVDWLIHMTLWEYIETYAPNFSLEIYANEIYYESLNKIAIPVVPNASVEFWEIKSLSIFIGVSNNKLYESKGGIENVGYDNRYGLKLVIDPKGWKKTPSWPSNKIVKNLTVKLRYTTTQVFRDIVINSLKFLIPYKNKKISELFNGMNIEFIWGPPATGKTTYIAKEVINEIKTKTKKIIILTPTNKSADVVVERVLGFDKDVPIYRFPHALSSDIPQYNILNKGKNPPSSYYCISTTIHRYIYDEIGSKRIREEDWDLIIIDEASMVELPFLIYVLMRNKGKRILIAGDPNQLTPVGETPDETQDIKGYSTENIYTILDLGNKLLTSQSKPSQKIQIKHINPNNQNQKFNVIILTYQYRSVRAIGDLYSSLFYNDILDHDRKSNLKPFDISIYNYSLKIYPITVFKFPVERKNPALRIYKGPRGSSYHIFSAVLAVELAKSIETKNKSVGIISPYRTQVDIMHNLSKAHNLKSTTVSTVHGFQGDERDVIIFVLNPPTTSKKRLKNTHFSNFRVRNVAISRARDYLVMLMPDLYLEDQLYEEIDSLVWRWVLSHLDSGGNLLKKDEDEDVEVYYLDLDNEILNRILNNIEIYKHLDVNLYPFTSSAKYTFFVKNKGAVDIYFNSQLTKEETR